MTTFSELIDIWYAGEMARLYGSSDPGEGRVLLGCPVWGKDFTECLVNNCLPSLMAPENLKALAGRARLVLYVDPTHAQSLAFAIRELEHKGIQLRLHEIPMEIIDAWTKQREQGHAKNLTYPLLGAAQDLLVQNAGRNGMAFGQLQADHCYNQIYFQNYFRLVDAGENAIAQIGICADIGPATEQLKAHRRADGTLSGAGRIVVSDIELGTIGFRNLHKRMAAFNMNKNSIPDRMPLSHFMMWQGRDKLFLSSCHMNAAYLSPRLCAVAPQFKGATIDSCLPALTKNDCLIAKAEHGLTFIELSGDQPFKQGHGTIIDFCREAWLQARFRLDYLWWTRQFCEIPIKPRGGFMADTEIAAQHERIIELMIAARGSGVALEICEGMFRREGVAS